MAFDSQPHLVGDLVEVRPLTVGDFDALEVAAADPMIWDQHPEDRHRPDVFRAYFDGQLASGGGLLVTDPSTGDVIGTSRYDRHSAERSSVEIGWTFLVRSRWGTGANAELKQLMLRHAFRFVDSVLFHVAPDNFRSQCAVEKLGARREAPRADGHETFRLRREDF